MSESTEARDRVGAALGGAAAGLVVGLTFISDDALGSIPWKTPSEFPLVSAARDLGLDFCFVRSDDPRATKIASALVQADVAVMWVIPGPFGRIASERGWASALADVIRARDQLKADLEAVAEEAAEGIRSAAAVGATAIVVAEDLSLASGFLMGPDDALELIVPSIGRLADAASGLDLRVALHSDGDVRVFMPALAREGFCAVHTGGNGWEGFTAQLGTARDNGMVLIGGLEGRDLRAGEQAARACGLNVAEAAASGGILVADDGGLTKQDELTAFAIAVKAAREDGKQ